MVPLSLTWSPKNATVLSSEKSQLGYPTVESERLLASAKPNTSRFSALEETDARAGDARDEAPVGRLVTGAVATCCAASCMTTGCGSSSANAVTMPDAARATASSGAARYL